MCRHGLLGPKQLGDDESRIWAGEGRHGDRQSVGWTCASGGADLRVCAGSQAGVGSQRGRNRSRELKWGISRRRTRREDPVWRGCGEERLQVQSTKLIRRYAENPFQAVTDHQDRE